MSATPTSAPPLYLYGKTKPFLPPPWKTTDDRLRGGASVSHLVALPSPPNSARFYGNLDTKALGGAGFASQFSPVGGEGVEGFEVEGEGVEEEEDNLEGEEGEGEGWVLVSSGDGDGKGEGGGGEKKPDKNKKNEKRKSNGWDLTPYTGLVLHLGKAKGRIFTFVVKDEEEEETEKKKKGLSWEVEFRLPHEEDEGGDGGGGGEDVDGDGDKVLVAKQGKVWMPWGKFRSVFRGREVDLGRGIRVEGVGRVGIMMRR